MAATVKTLLQHHGELYWAARKANPGYYYGLSLDARPEGLQVRVVYVLSNVDHNDDTQELITPDMLLTCYTLADLEENGIISSSLMDEDNQSALGWYCVEESTFSQENIDDLQQSNDSLENYLSIILQIMLISPEEVEAGLPTLDDISFFDLLAELEGISELIDAKGLQKPLPFDFHLIGDALFGWQHACEADFH